MPERRGALPGPGATVVRNRRTVAEERRAAILGNHLRQMRALITGGSGFLGSYLCRRLASAGWDMFVAATSRAGEHRLQDLKIARFLLVDVRDWSRIRQLVAEVPCEVVFHIAGQGRGDQPHDLIATNVQGTAHVLDAVAEVCPRARVIVVGSSAEYGDQGSRPIRENQVPNPRGTYAVSKWCQTILSLDAANRGLDVQVARLFNLIGQEQSTSYVLGSLTHQFRLMRQTGRPSAIRLGRTDTVRDFIDVRDVADALVRLAESGRSGEVYNVASGTGRTIAQCIETLVRLTGIRPKLEVAPELVRPDDVLVSVADNTKIHADTGWVPARSFDQSLADCLAVPDATNEVA